MNTTVQARNILVDDFVNKLLENKFQKLKKIFGEHSSARVFIEYDRNQLFSVRLQIKDSSINLYCKISPMQNIIIEFSF